MQVGDILKFSTSELKYTVVRVTGRLGSRVWDLTYFAGPPYWLSEEREVLTAHVQEPLDNGVTLRKIGIDVKVRDAHLEKEKREEEEYIAKHTYIPQKRSICLNLDQ